ncbi:MFS transporter [Infirmifilum lucidum]|uniref:MFS transporter n=1 Tax=Infirmifilum lucidum TaxID=2776706 RepID=A0A7L9FHQ1_9CREN|nr:MFS transporter [Infirmifilum lucidum]QOJ79358.1 MFS transporter [Infirmifilum lucidum]
MTGPYIQLYLSRLGAMPEDLSLVQSLQQYGNALSRVVGGYFTDRHGRKKIIWVGTMLVSATYLLMALVSDWRLYAVISSVNSFSLFYQPALESIRADSVALDARGRIYAFIQFLSGLTSSLAPLGGAAVVNALGLVDGVRLGFILSGLVGFAIAVARLKYLEETLPSNNAEGFLEAYREALKLIKSSIASMLVVDVLLNLVGAMTFLDNYYMFYYLGVDKTALGVLATVGGLTGLLFTLPAGFVVDKYGRGLALTWGYILGTLNLLIFVLTPPKTRATLPLLLLSAVIGSIGGPLYGLAHDSLRADLVPKEYRGRVFALLGIPPAIAWSAGAMIGGWMYSALGPQIPFIASLALRILLAPLLIALFKDMTRLIDEQLRDNG